RGQIWSRLFLKSMTTSATYRFAVVLTGAWLMLAGRAAAQDAWHYLDKADMPPGVIGLRQLERGGPRPGYFQPVRITAPNGALISVAAAGGYTRPQRDTTL